MRSRVLTAVLALTVVACVTPSAPAAAAPATCALPEVITRWFPGVLPAAQPVASLDGQLGEVSARYQGQRPDGRMTYVLIEFGDAWISLASNSRGKRLPLTTDGALTLRVPARPAAVDAYASALGIATGGLKPGTQLELCLAPASTLGPLPAQASGKGAANRAIPAGLAAGTTNLVMTGTDKAGRAFVVGLGVLLNPLR